MSAVATFVLWVTSILVVLEAAYLAFELRRAYNHHRIEQAQAPSEVDLYLAMRTRKNETVRRLRHVAKDARGVPSRARHRDDWLR